MESIKFTVDAALLKELGERLVGKPHIALAELVKNSYDADATEVVIELEPRRGLIKVRDNGHGMNFDEFKDYWMRIGSVHKGKLRVSEDLKRNMTGSKGVGRLAVQFLAHKLELYTVSKKELHKTLFASVDWRRAIKAVEITKATVQYEVKKSAKVQAQGTSIILTNLKYVWNSDLVKKLAAEIWWLQPPFRRNSFISGNHKDTFYIKFVCPEKEYSENFNKEIRAVMDIWNARLIGMNANGKVNISLEFAGEKPIFHQRDIRNCRLKNGDFEIRIFHLQRRQPRGVKVAKAREYFTQHGGVHVYDTGFHLPYYGTANQDWLGIEVDHSHRLSKSKLLPKKLKDQGGMNYLPTLERIFGVVNVNTSKEPNLNIQITRDRLSENKAFDQLVDIVRYSIDFYAMHEAKRVYEEKVKKREIEPILVERVNEILAKYKLDIPGDLLHELQVDIRNAIESFEKEAKKKNNMLGLLGPLATAGISSLAYQHELKRQFSSIDDIVNRIGKIDKKKENIRVQLNEIKENLSSWINRARAANALFSFLADSENREIRKRFKAKWVLDDIEEQISVLMRGIPIVIDQLDKELLLPKATLAEWGAIFQNILLNAYNAMVDSATRRIEISSKKSGKFREILIQDTGCGVDLKNSDELFKPFVRKIKISPERRDLGYGGTGLGLAIVKLLAENIGCKVSFVKPDKELNTAFSLRWREK